MLAALLVLLQTPVPDLPLSVPPAWADRVVYCRTFERADGKPDVCLPGIEEAGAPETAADGMRGRAGLTGQGRTFHLRGPALSPHRPLTLSLWWRLRQDAGKETGFGLAHLQGTKGFVSLFVRSGPWCGLDRPAAVLQVYYLPGIQNINAIYDRDILDRGDLKAGVWHHTALVVSAASSLAVWTDGRKVCECRLIGRPFREDDGLRDFEIGSAGGPDVVVDEVVLLNRPLAEAELTEYERATRQMREAGYPVRAQ